MHEGGVRVIRLGSRRARRGSMRLSGRSEQLGRAWSVIGDLPPIPTSELELDAA